MEYSYMRVAEADKYPAELKNTVFADTRGDPESPEFQRLLTVIQPNDSVHIPTLTDLGSSLAQVCEKWQQLLDLGVRIWLLDCPAAGKDPAVFGELLQYISYSQKRFKNPKHRTVIRTKPGSSDRAAGASSCRNSLPRSMKTTGKGV